MVRLPSVLPSPDAAKLPKIIWMYWDQGYESAPEIVKYCLSSWKRHNPNWDIRFLTLKTIDHYLDMSEFDKLFKKAQRSEYFDYPKAIYSDFLRLKLLQAHGGVWADATLLCAYPLDTWLHTVMPSGVMMFQRPPDYACPVANFFIAAQKNNNLIRCLEETLESYLRQHRLISAYYGLESYLRQRRSVQAYYTFHYILDFLIKFDKQTRAIFHAMPALDARRLHALQTEIINRKNGSKAVNLPDLTGIPIHKLSWKKLEGVDITVRDVKDVLSHQG